MKYTRFLGAFIADSATTAPRFASSTPGAFGIILDAVSVMAVPGSQYRSQQLRIGNPMPPLSVTLHPRSGTSP